MQNPSILSLPLLHYHCRYYAQDKRKIDIRNSILLKRKTLLTAIREALDVPEIRRLLQWLLLPGTHRKNCQTTMNGNVVFNQHAFSH
jgi:hypothetical protein